MCAVMFGLCTLNVSSLLVFHRAAGIKWDCTVEKWTAPALLAARTCFHSHPSAQATAQLAEVVRVHSSPFFRRSLAALRVAELLC